MTTYYLNPAGSDSASGLNRGTNATTGAWRTPAHAAAVLVAGDTVKILGVAGNAASYPTSALDYTVSAYIAPMPAGSVTAGYVTWMADETGPMPTIGSPGFGFYQPNFNAFDGLYFVATTGGNPASGIIKNDGTGPMILRNCTLNTNAQVAMVGVVMSAGLIANCDFYGGTPNPTASAGADLIACTNYNTLILGNRIHHARGCGVTESTTGYRILANRIYRCAGDGIKSANTGPNFPTSIVGNTIDANGGHGIILTATAGVAYVDIANNLITNHVGAGKYGITFSDGTTATNDARKRICDYNNLYNNTGNYQNVSAGEHDLAVDPGYANASAGDFTPSNAALKAAFP